MARVLPLSEAKAHLSRLVGELENEEEELVITRNGRPVAVLMSAEEFQSWQETREIARDRSLMREIKRGLRQLERDRRFTFEEVFGEPLAVPKRARSSMDTSKPAIIGRVKTGHFGGGQDGVGLAVFVLRVQGCGVLGSPASWSTLEDVTVVK